MSALHDQHVLTDEATLKQIEEALLATYFRNYDQAFLQTETGQDDIRANVFRRYNNSLAHVVPWVARHIDLHGKTLVEIGSGTGSSTAAFAHFVERIDGYDIDAQALAGAQARMEAMGLDNVALHLVAPEKLVETLQANHSGGVDVVLLFAVLEHQTIRERHETIRLCWQLLNPDGVLVVTETPNLLHYTDLHTSQLPFLHLLPSELYARYAGRSPREGFGQGFAALDDLPLQDLDTMIMRWGRGASFHDFELAIGPDHARHLVADGFEPEMLGWFAVSLEEELLRHYFVVRQIKAPLAFSRVVLNLIYRRSEGSEPKPASVPEPVFIADRQLVRDQEAVIRSLEAAVGGLDEQLRAVRQHLDEVLASKRWLVGSLVAAPFRKLKALLSRGPNHCIRTS